MADKLPTALKPVHPFLVISKQFSKRDPVVAYYANMYAVQEGIRLAKHDPGAKAYLLTLMDEVEKMKAALKDEEALASDVVGQAHVEEVALKLFDFADGEDRAGRFTKNMIKAFFTASHIFTVLKQFGELSEEVEEKMKYAKWKAVEIDRCLKNGITPTPGPPGEPPLDNEVTPPPPVGFNVQPPPSMDQPSPSIPPAESKPIPKPRQMASHDPAPQKPSYDEYEAGATDSWGNQPKGPSGVQLGPQEINKAQKLCKFASSALEYEDIQGAIEYLGKAMNLLQTGKEEG